jgi:hypothetical protein
MWTNPFRDRNKGARMSALAISDTTHDMLRQMALPLVPERRVKGALHHVSRETGVSYSKLRKLYYRLSDHILATEWQAIRMAYQRHVESHEQKLEAELAQLRAIKATRLQGELSLHADSTACPRVVAKAQDAD